MNVLITNYLKLYSDDEFYFAIKFIFMVVSNRFFKSKLRFV